jgi:3-ketosteroid 9alpha-monooxygenase subunit A
VMSNYMVVAHTPVDVGATCSLELRMAVMLKKIAGQEMSRLVDLYMANLKSGFEDDIRIWENKLYREVPVLCDGDGPIAQLRRWYRQFYASPETQVAEQPEQRA